MEKLIRRPGETMGSQPESSTSSDRPTSEVKARDPYVVGIGASAGGLEALERFFDHLPKATGMAFVIVQHLSPDFRSLMDELLARHTDLPIKLVEDGMPIEPDHVYLIPPRKEMIISGGHLLLSERHRQHDLSLPIDVFFRSLAQDCGPRAVAIVLSGGGSDGSRGIRDVHEAGGLVIVQDQGSAQFDGMPKTAREAGVARWVLSPDAMPEVLLAHAKSPPMAPLVTSPTRSDGAGAENTDALRTVYRMLQDEFEIDFNHYKPSTVTRRIERRIRLAFAGDIDEYVARLRRERAELDVLYRDLLIGVTRFFRNEQAFEALERRVLPELFSRGRRDAPIRVWVAGCATGEEAYSLAILLYEASKRHGDRPVKVFASDVHRGSLDIAARAVYAAESVATVSQERLERYFIRRGDSVQVVPEIRQLIVFAPHNVIKDPPFTRLDLVSCRNLLIYLQPAAQQKALSLFHFGLERGGLVLLGPSESPGPMVEAFEVVDKHWRIYRKRSEARIPVDARFQGPPRLQGRPEPSSPSAMRLPLSHLLGAYDALLEKFMPPSLLVSDRGELLHSFGGASQFLRHRDGRQGLDILDAVDGELKMALAGGIRRALANPRPAVFRSVRIETGGGSLTYRVTLSQVPGRSGSPTSVLIAFEPTEPPEHAVAALSPMELELSAAPSEQLSALQSELDSTRENLQAAIEELETSNEEMQTTNEEMHASNEELQSTNEELQSVNEELYSVNAEYQRKIAELTELTNDMENLLSSTDVGTLFLNRALEIRKFTPQMAHVFHLLPTDIGRPIGVFAHNIRHPQLLDDVMRVLDSGERIERELQDRDGRALLLRILPYLVRGAVDGVVLTLIDLSTVKAAEDALFHERYLLNSLLSNVPDAIYFKDARGRFIRANRAVAEQFGLSDPEALVGKTPFELTEDGALAFHEEDEKVLRTGEGQHYRLEAVAPSARTSGERWVMATRHPLRDPSSRVVGVLAVLRDVTKQKRAEEKIHDAVRRRDQFLAMLSHELRNPLAAVVAATSLVKASPISAELAHRIEIVDRQSKHMSRLLDDLLEASRVTQNKIELRRQRVELGSIARDAVEATRATISGKGLDLAVQIDAAPIPVLGDATRLQQLQVNLLNNAAKYTPRGGHVWLDVGREGAHAKVCVRDDGVGIAPENLDTIFELFVQSPRTLERADGGLGVGLTLVRSLVLMHGGTVTARSDGPGKGSEFVVRLPLATESVEERAPRPRAPIPKGGKIVVVEDSADGREMLCELLGLAGYECYAAETGTAGLELVRDVRPEAAILDLGLPELDGLEMARRIRQDASVAHVLLIALTGYGQAADRARALQAGFDEHVVKPVDFEKLTRVLSRTPEMREEPGSDRALPSEAS